MTLTELKYIVAVARERHFGKAADACHVSQPTLSVAIKKLEEELDVKLFERSANEVSATPLGEEIIRHAQLVLEQAAEIKEIAKRGKDPLAGALRLGVIYTIGPYLLPDLMRQIMKKAPQMPLMLQENFTVKLMEMLRAGEIDCAIIARPPTCFLEGHPDVVRLFPDFLDMEDEFFARTKVWPIMHIIAMKKSVVDENPWVPRNLFNAFQESKRRSIERLMDPAVSRYPLPWLATYARKMRDKFEGDTFPYGIEENRPTWELMAKYTFQQGIAHREFTPEEIFPQGMMTKVVI